MSWTPAGFQRQRLPDLLEALEADLRQGLGEGVDLGASSVLGRVTGITALRLSEVWELGEAIAWSRSPDGAVDESLDEVVALSALEREPGETDASLRVRWLEGVSSAEAASIDAIRQAIGALPGVARATVLENTSDLDVGGRPPHSLELIVDADPGAAMDLAIANRLWAVRPAGLPLCSTMGMSVSVTVTDAGGNPQEVRFSRTERVEIWLRVQVTAHPEEDVPAALASMVSAAILAQLATLKTGEDVVMSRLAAVVFPISGVYDVSVSAALSPSGPWHSGKLKILPAQRAALDPANLTFTLIS